MTRVTSTAIRKGNGWHKGFVERRVSDTVFLSVVFSWDLDKVLVRRDELVSQGLEVRIGGPAAKYAGVQSDGCPNAVKWHHLGAVTTSTGCPNKCPFCIVPIIEGDLVEKSEWTPSPLLYDNNITACSRRHFDKVVDSLRTTTGIDINQGISATLTP